MQKAQDSNWERKIITMSDLLAMNLSEKDINDSYQELREWMLEGENNEWRYSKNAITKEVILERR